VYDGLIKGDMQPCVFLNSRITARATVAGSGARARSRSLVRAASPHLSLTAASATTRWTNV
jgi:hypothetical protein